MLDLLGTIGGNVLSLPGILGFAAGLMTRSPVLAAILGGVIGLIEAMTFAGFTLAGVTGTELAVSILVGIASGTPGSAVRRKGTTV